MQKFKDLLVIKMKKFNKDEVIDNNLYGNISLVKKSEIKRYSKRSSLRTVPYDFEIIKIYRDMKFKGLSANEASEKYNVRWGVCKRILSKVLHKRITDKFDKKLDEINNL